MTLPACSHERATGEFTDELGTYRKTCDDCGADVTDPVEGAEAEAMLRKLRGESTH